jgi:elongation factor P hydroxylase
MEQFAELRQLAQDISDGAFRLEHWRLAAAAEELAEVADFGAWFCELGESGGGGHASP